MWNPLDGRLWLVDVTGMAVHAVDPVSGVGDSFGVDRPVTALVPRGAGGWLGVAGRSLRFLDLVAGVSHCWLTIPGPGEVELNDAVCGRDGVLYVGSVDRTGARRGQLYAVTPDGRVRVVVDGVGASNGVDSSADGGRVYHADTFAGTVTSYPDGAVVALDRPDGLAVDSQDCLWVALWGGGQVRRYLRGGKLDRVLSLPVPLVTNVAFGGPGLRTLYVTTARSDGVELSGGVFAADVGVSGLPVEAFAV